MHKWDFMDSNVAKTKPRQKAFSFYETDKFITDQLLDPKEYRK